MTNSTPTTLGGYAITSYKEVPLGCGVAFTATITKDGGKVLTVENDGNGGSHMYRGVGTDWAGWREAETAFEAFAQDWAKDTEYAGFEEADALVWHLIEVASLNRKRTPVFLLDDETYFKDGMYRTLPASASRADAVGYIAATYPGRNARVWDRDLSEFVPVEG